MSSEFVCNICGKLFSVETNLNDHNCDVHTEVESPCNLCDKSFKSKKKLRYHTISTHVEKETFNCDIKSDGIQCINFSTTNSNLRAHKKRVHVKPIKANLPMHVCGLTWTNIVIHVENLWSQILVTTPVTCAKKRFFLRSP